MKRMLLLLISVFALSSVSWAGGGSSIREAAYKLDRAATEFYDRVHYRYGYSDITHQAKALAKATHRFCSDVERQVPFRRLNREFDRLQSRYDAMRYQLKYADRRYGHDPFSRGHDQHYGKKHRKKLGFKQVRKWFERLDSAMYREHERYVRHHSRQRHDAHYYANNSHRDRGYRNNRRVRRDD